VDVFEAAGVANPWLTTDGTISLETSAWLAVALVAFELFKSASPVGEMVWAAAAPVACGAAYSCLMASMTALTFIFLA
jgi:hypothetical protein